MRGQKRPPPCAATCPKLLLLLLLLNSHKTLKYLSKTMRGDFSRHRVPVAAAAALQGAIIIGMIVVK